MFFSRTTHTELNDFYHQLHLLVKSELPLPQSLYQLGKSFRKKDFQKVLSQLSEDTANGEPLSEAMKRFPAWFPKSQVKMIAAAEKSEALGEMLNDLALLNQLNYQITAKIKEIAITPLLTTFFAILTFMAFLIFVCPQVEIVFFDFMDMLEGQALPKICEWAFVLFACSNFCLSFLKPVLAILGVSIISIIWLFSDQLSAKRTLLRLIRLLPFSGRIYQNLLAARLCLLWAFYLKHGCPTVEALEIIDELIEDRNWSKTLRRIRERCEYGESIEQAFSDEKLIPGLIKITLRHCSESNLPEELEKLGSSFRAKAIRAFAGAKEFWLYLFLVLMTIFAAIIIISMFLPLIFMLKVMGA